jgi:hypothetical protein
MEVARMRQQLRRGDVLNGDRVVSGIGDDGISMRVVMRRGQESGHFCKHRLDDLNFERTRSQGTSPQNTGQSGGRFTSLLQQALHVGSGPTLISISASWTFANVCPRSRMPATRAFHEMIGFGFDHAVS